MAQTNSITEISQLSARLKAVYGEALTERIVAGYRTERLVTLRVNSLKTDAATVRKTLSAYGIESFPVSWYSDALIVRGAREGALRATPLYDNGEIYLQSLSSMLPPLYLDPQAEEAILDMTAAPGGKTTQISAMSGGKAFITACERDKVRAQRLEYNIKKQNAPRVSVLNADALKLDDFFRFDKVLLDAPCSGSGTLQLNEPLKISDKLIENSVKLQEKLLAKALRLLKKGGTLVYSTCSVLPCENDEILAKVLPTVGAEIVPIEKIDGISYLPSTAGTICVCPDELYEGFFVAKIRKT